MTPAPHLGEHELIDAIDGVLTGDRAAHLLDCEACAGQVDGLRAIARRAADVEVPEPPPFFWNQLSARVRAALADEGPPPRAFWQGWRPAAALAVVAALIVVVSAAAGRWPQPGVQPTATMAGRAIEDVAIPNDAMGDLETDRIDQDDAWAMVRTLAEDLDHDEMEGEGLSARPGSIDRLALGLSEAERIELARLLEEQLNGRRVPESVS